MFHTADSIHLFKSPAESKQIFQNVTYPENHCPYLYCLPVVNFYNMKAEAVDSFPGCNKDAPRRIKMASNIH